MPETFPRGGLPPILPYSTNTSEIFAELLSTYETLSGSSVAPASPTFAFINWIAYCIASINAGNNHAAQQNFLTYATGSSLDGIGYLMGVARQPASHATTRVKFTASAGLASAYIVPAGTQLAAGLVLFETTEDIVVPGASLSGTGYARALVAGAEANNLPIGAVNTIVNPIPFIPTVESLDVTSGGAPIESDEAYAARIRSAPDRYSVAGPVEAYRALTFDVSPAITDVAVLSPSPGVVEVYAMTANGPAGAGLKAQIEDYLSASIRRPLTDDVQVKDAQAQAIYVNLEYKISESKRSQGAAIQAAINAWRDQMDRTVVEGFGLGVDFNGDFFIRRLLELGAKRVYDAEAINETAGDIDVWPFFQIDSDEYFSSTGFWFHFGGYEDD